MLTDREFSEEGIIDTFHSFLSGRQHPAQGTVMSHLAVLSAETWSSNRCTQHGWEQVSRPQVAMLSPPKNFT